MHAPTAITGSTVVSTKTAQSPAVVALAVVATTTLPTAEKTATATATNTPTLFACLAQKKSLYSLSTLASSNDSENAENLAAGNPVCWKGTALQQLLLAQRVSVAALEDDEDGGGGIAVVVAFEFVFGGDNNIDEKGELVSLYGTEGVVCCFAELMCRSSIHKKGLASCKYAMSRVRCWF